MSNYTWAFFTCTVTSETLPSNIFNHLLQAQTHLKLRTHWLQFKKISNLVLVWNRLQDSEYETVTSIKYESI